MRQLRKLPGAMASVLFAAGVLASAQAPSPSAATQAQGVRVASGPVSSVTGGRLHGVVKSGQIALPGVTVTAQNTLTGKRYSTTTDITGSWSLNIPLDGRYVIRTEFAAFAQQSQEALLNETGRDRGVDFQLVLASRAAEQATSEEEAQGIDPNAVAQAIRQLTGNGAENLSLLNALSADTDTGAGTAGASGAALPSIAGNSSFESDSVNINGQSGQVSPLAGLDVNRIRDAIEAARASGALPGTMINGVPVQGGLFGGGGGGFGGVMMMGPGGGGMFFGGRRGGGGGGGRGNFRGFNPGQPHGAFFWDGSNSALNAQPFSLAGQQQQQPANGTNRFGLSFISAPYIPHLTKPSGKDTVFLSLSGQRNSNPYDYYGIVPTLAQRQGDFTGQPPIYDPATGQQFVSNGTPNVIPASRYMGLPAYSLLNCANSAPDCQPVIPLPNLSGASANGYNYHLLTTAQSNSTQAGVRYMRSLGPNTGMGGFGGLGGFGRRGGRSQNTGLRQSINFNYNWSHSASDETNIFPAMGGKSGSDSYALQAGYVIGYHRFTSVSNVGWNRSNSRVTNFFTNSANDVARNSGIYLPNDVPLNYGLPNLSISNLPESFSETQPSFSISQTISVSEVLSWIHGKHNLRFGGDYRRVHHDFLAGSDATGTFSFTGWFTQAGSGAQKDPSTGSAVADFLLGYAASTSINSSLAKSYLRENAIDGFAMDDWRVLSRLTLNYGVRYEFYAPYYEKFGHLAMIDTNPAAGFSQQAEVNAGGVGPVSGIHLPDSLVDPSYTAFAPRVGLALRLPKSTVLRAGFGMNYMVGQYAGFATTMAHQPPFTNQQTNAVVSPSGQVVGTCALSTQPTCFSNGFGEGASLGNYALDPHYALPYVQVWNLDVQKSLRWGIVMNVGYNGSRASHLDMKIAPRRTPSSPGTDPSDLIFNYDQAVGFYKMNAGTVRVNKRLSKGIALGAYYQFAHGIDSASSVNGSSGSVAQNWQDLAAEEGNSSLVVRHSVSGNYLYELPFGKDRKWATSGVRSHVLEGFSVSGQFTFASGMWLTPTFTSTTYSLSCGTAGALRANVNPGVPPVQGSRQWINPQAYSQPSPTPNYCDAFGTAPRNSIEGPGTVSNNMAFSKTMQMGETRSMEIRASMTNAFNTVQYSGVNTMVGTQNFGQVTKAAPMRAFQFTARFRF